MNILIADDHPLFRRGIKEMIMEALHPVKVTEAEDAHQMYTLLQQGTWDLVVMDVTMPGPSGPDGLKTVKELYPSLPVLILSMHAEDQYAIRMFKAGANGYVMKGLPPDELIRAIKKVLAGGQYVSAALGERFAMTVKGGLHQALHDHLSNREYEVLVHLGSGKTVGEVATALNLSVTTISTYRARILEKMNMRTNAELTRYTMDHHLT